MTDFQPFSHFLAIFSCFKLQCFDFPSKRASLTSPQQTPIELVPSDEESVHLTPVGFPWYDAIIGQNDALEALPGSPSVFRITRRISNGQSSLDAKYTSLYANFVGMTNPHIVCNIKLKDCNHGSQIMMLISQLLSSLILLDSGLPLVSRVISATIT